MITVRLFTSGKGVGFVHFDKRNRRMSPQGLLSDESIEVIRKDLEAGWISGWVCGYYWYRQAMPSGSPESASSVQGLEAGAYLAIDSGVR